MTRAVWNGAVLAEAPRTRWVDGNHHSVDGTANADAAWYYPHPWPVARLVRIKGHVAFWHGSRAEGTGEPERPKRPATSGQRPEETDR